MSTETFSLEGVIYTVTHGWAVQEYIELILIRVILTRSLEFLHTIKCITILMISIIYQEQLILAQLDISVMTGEVTPQRDMHMYFIQKALRFH